jgi:hypothetical protein
VRKELESSLIIWRQKLSLIELPCDYKKRLRKNEPVGRVEGEKVENDKPWRAEVMFSESNRGFLKP